MSAVAPNKLSERHRYIAWLELGGAGNNEIALALGLTPSWVSTVRHSPLYKVMLADMRERVTDENVDAVRAFFQREAMKSAKVLVEVRDGPDVAQSRLAANDIIDRVPGLSKIHKTESDDSVRIVFEGMGELMAAIAEDEGKPARVIDGSARELSASAGPDVIRPKTLEEFVDTYDDGR